MIDFHILFSHYWYSFSKIWTTCCIIHILLYTVDPTICTANYSYIVRLNLNCMVFNFCTLLLGTGPKFISMKRSACSWPLRRIVYGLLYWWSGCISKQWFYHHPPHFPPVLCTVATIINTAQAIMISISSYKLHIAQL